MAVVLSRALGAAAGLLLARYLLDGMMMDVGASTAGWAGAVLALGVGCGLRSRMRLPRLSEGVALTLLVPLRGPVTDAVLALGGNRPVAALLAILISLLPVGFALGRQLQPLVTDAGLDLLAGWCLGELLYQWGAVSWCPGIATGLVSATLLAGLAEVRRPSRSAVDESLSPVPLGIALGLLVVSLRRLVPAYVEPPPYGDVDIRLALLAPALLVAWPTSLLARSGERARWVRAAAALGLAVAILVTLTNLGLYRTGLHVELGWRLHGWAVRFDPWLTDWRAWLLTFTGLGAAALGIVFGSLRGAATGALLLGLSIALAAEEVVQLLPVRGPALLLLLGAGAALLAAPVALFGMRGLLAVPLLGLPFLLRPLAAQPGFDEVRRAGELAVESFSRTRRADITLISGPGPGATSRDGQRIYRRTFIGHEPALTLEGPLPVPGEADSRPKRTWGLRIGGVALHADHPPSGAEGTVGRLTRLLARPGRMLVVGAGSELVAADLRGAAMASSVEVASDLALDPATRRILLDAMGTGDLPGSTHTNPALAIRAMEGGLDTVVVAPGRTQWQGSSALAAAGTLRRLARLLGPAGRCLLWLDTGGLDARCLGSRVAAFGDAFGTRSAAWVEMRGLDAPFVLLLGWVTEAGQLSAAELGQRMPGSWRSGLRTRLRRPSDLGAMLALDGAGVVAAAQRWPLHDRAGPVGPRRGAPAGWSAVGAMVDADARLERVITGLEASQAGASGLTADLLAGLASHADYTYRPESVNERVVEIPGDIDWERFAVETAHYTRAARQNPDNPLLHLALSALLEPLVLTGDYTRFSEVFEQTGAVRMDCWRLSLLEAAVAEAGLQPERAAAALRRARALAASP